MIRPVRLTVIDVVEEDGSVEFENHAEAARFLAWYWTCPGTGGSDFRYQLPNRAPELNRMFEIPELEAEFKHLHGNKPEHVQLRLAARRDACALLGSCT